MSQSNVEKVRNLVTGDPELQKRLEATRGEDAFMQTLIGIGAEKGLAFTAKDLDTWKTGEGASIELNEEQLTSIAGGQQSTGRNGGQPAKESYGTSYGNSIFCAFCSGGSFMT